MKKIIITGANGFVGQNLIKHLKGDYDVYGIDRMKCHNLDDAHGFTCDISDFNKIDEVIKRVSPNIVIHLAAIVHKNNADTSEKNYMFVNYECSKFLFDKCKEYKVDKVIYASTIEVYGESNLNIINENTPTEPKSYYAISKLKAEQYLENLYREENNRFAILRFCPLYGKGFTLNIDKRVYLKTGTLSYYFKDGSYTFDFCSINNVKDFIKHLCNKDLNNTIFNVSDTNPISVKEIISTYRKYNKGIITLRLPYLICKAIISLFEFTIGSFSKKDLYLSKRNFDKLFQSTQYSNEKATSEIGEFHWNIENTLFGDDL